MEVEYSLFQEILDKARDSVWVLNENNVIEYVNCTASILTGYSKEELVGSSFSKLIPTSYGIDHKSMINNIIRNNPSHSTVLNKIREFYILTKDNVPVPVELIAFEISSQQTNSRLFAGIMRDISSRKKQEENQKLTLATLKKLAFIDELTMIPNRRSFYDSFRKLLAGMQRHTREAVAAVVDIDNFKDINDTYGHDVGDMVLKNVSNIFLENLREEDNIGRIGGEEFGIILPDTSMDSACVVLERLRVSVKNYRFFVFENFYLNVTISAGYVNVNSSQSIEEAIKSADIALYKAKSNGRDTIEKFLG